MLSTILWKATYSMKIFYPVVNKIGFLFDHTLRWCSNVLKSWKHKWPSITLFCTFREVVVDNGVHFKKIYLFTISKMFEVSLATVDAEQIELRLCLLKNFLVKCNLFWTTFLRFVWWLSFKIRSLWGQSEIIVKK